MSEMTNSEIKCEHENYEPIGDCGEFKWCKDCGALNIFFKEWQLPTRTPEPTKAELEKMEEDISVYGATYRKDGKRIDPKDIFTNIPTKAENGLVPLSEKALAEFIVENQGLEEKALAEFIVENQGLEEKALAEFIGENQGLEEKALAEFIGEDQGLEESAVILANKIYAKFGTPSITKEQLLAILPAKKNMIQLKIMSIKEMQDGYNTAIDQMKQRIEELFKKESV